jgi:hypothetical protein
MRFRRVKRAPIPELNIDHGIVRDPEPAESLQASGEVDHRDPDDPPSGPSAPGGIIAW